MRLKIFFAFIICVIFAVFTVLLYRSVREEIIGDEARPVITQEMKESCLTCHEHKHNEGVFFAWKQSKHSEKGIGCELCHIVSDKEMKDEIKRVMSLRGIKESQCQDERVNNVVPPKVCSQCHPKQYNEFVESSHGNAYKKLKMHLNLNEDSKFFDNSDCFRCHQIEFKCTSCHSRHEFSIEVARRPETCGVCHSGERHPQKETYLNTLHGVTYQTKGQDWDWGGNIEEWHEKQEEKPNSVPLCITCHMPNGKHNNVKPEKIDNFERLCKRCHVSNNSISFAMIDHSSINAQHYAIEVANKSGNIQCKICHNIKKLK